MYDGFMLSIVPLQSALLKPILEILRKICDACIYTSVYLHIKLKRIKVITGKMAVNLHVHS